MKYSSIFLCATFILSTGFFSLKPKEKEPLKDSAPQLKILIRKDSPGALIEAKGNFSVFNPESNKKLSSGTGKRYYLYPLKDGLKWGEGYPGIYQISLQPDDKKDTFLVDGIEYEGSLSVFEIDDQISIVNQVPLENYLKYALSETFNGEHIDSKILKCLAIILRTQLYYSVNKNKDSYWQIDQSKNHFLGYSQTKIDKYIDDAVDSTKSVIMTYNYRPFHAQWTEHSAGSTANYPMIFRKNTPSPTGIDTPYARKDKEKSFWTFAIQKNQLAQLVKTNRITAIDTYEDKDSGRIYALKIKDGNHSIDFDYFNFQKIIGTNFLKSNLFTVKLDKDSVKFEGFGEGHGVGLCLFSANEMAKRGSTVEQILLDFFPGALLQEIKKLDFSKDGLDDF